MNMHLRRAALLWFYSTVVCLLLPALIASTLSLQRDELETNRVESDEMVDVKKKPDTPEGYNEIIEKVDNELNEPAPFRKDSRFHSTDYAVADDTRGVSEQSTADETLDAKDSPPLREAEQLSSSHRTNPYVVKASAPKYMLDLYHKFSKDKYSHPMANIVRSFTNINEENSFTPLAHEDDDPNATSASASAASAKSDNSSRVHRMLFNLTNSIGRDEEIYLAELRLFTLVETDRNLYEGANRRVTVSEVILASSPEGHRPHPKDKEAKIEQIVLKEIYGRHSGWETIAVTEAVKRWVRQRGSNPLGDTHMLEIRIETMARLKDDLGDSATPSSPVVDISAKPHNENEPLLLVFSNDRRRRRLFESNDLEEILQHEIDHRPKDPEGEYDYYEDEFEEEEYEESAAADGRRRRRSVDYDSRLRKRTAGSAKRNGAVRRTPREADRPNEKAKSKEDDLDRSTHEEYPFNAESRQETTNIGDTTGSSDEDNEDGNADEFRLEIQNGSRPVRRRRVRRSRKRSPRRDICRRKAMLVNFQDIGWDSWIIAPPAYQAYECTGKCYFPLSDRMTPTKHSIIQSHVNAIYPSKASPTCCVPTKLDPISILYIDDQGVVTYKYKYDGMIVSECGCR